MTDTRELRRLAQAATPHVGHACKYQDEHWLREGHVDFENADLFIASERPQEDAAFYAAANPAVIIELLDRLEAAENENAKLRIALAEKVTSEATLRDLNFGNGFINATFEGGAIQLMVDALATQFVENGAANYIEMQFHSEAALSLLFTLQRVDGKTPHQLRVEAEQERDALRAKIERMEKQEPVATVIKEGDSRYWMSERLWTFPDGKYPLYALPGAQAQPAPSFADAYQGAMEEVAIWKKRALEAEDLNRKFIAEINGPTHMGEPAQPAPSVPDGWKLVPIEPTPEMIRALIDGANQYDSWNEGYRDMLTAAPEAKP